MNYLFKARRIWITCPGFTLTELMVVVAVIGLLFGLLFPLVGRMVESAEESKCIANWRTFSEALQLYVIDHDGKLPSTAYMNRGGVDQEVRIALLPYFYSGGAPRGIGKLSLTNDDRGFQCPDEDWSYGFNVFLTPTTRDKANQKLPLYQPMSSFDDPSRLIFGIDQTNGNRWLGSSSWSSNSKKLAGVAPKPHRGRVGVCWLDGHVTMSRVSELTVADVTRGTYGYSEADDDKPLGDPEFDK